MPRHTPWMLQKHKQIDSKLAITNSQCNFLQGSTIPRIIAKADAKAPRLKEKGAATIIA